MQAEAAAKQAAPAPAPAPPPARAPHLRRPRSPRRRPAKHPPRRRRSKRLPRRRRRRCRRRRKPSRDARRPLVLRYADEPVVGAGAGGTRALAFFGVRQLKSRRSSEFDDSLGRLAAAGAETADLGSMSARDSFPSPHRRRRRVRSWCAAALRRRFRKRPSWSRRPARTSGRVLDDRHAAGDGSAQARRQRRDHQQRDRDQPRPGRSAGRSRFPHGLRPLRSGRGPDPHRHLARARPPRPEAQAPRGLLRLGQQGAVPDRRARARREPPGGRAGRVGKDPDHGQAARPRGCAVLRRRRGDGRCRRAGSTSTSRAARAAWTSTSWATRCPPRMARTGWIWTSAQRWAIWRRPPSRSPGSPIATSLLEGTPATHRQHAADDRAHAPGHGRNTAELEGPTVEQPQLASASPDDPAEAR